MNEDKLSRIKNHLLSFKRCYQANKSKLNPKSVKRINKYMLKIEKEITKNA